MINKIKSTLKEVDHILHIADIHLRNWKRHQEFKEVFQKLFVAVDALPPNSIVTVGGDIVHAKTDMSPELIKMVSYLFTELANRVPTIVITGNHDTNLNNNNRLDALTPIVEAIKHKNLFYLRNTGLYEIGDVAISVMSLLDDPKEYITYDKVQDVSKYKHTIAMYHGTISNSKVDSGLTLSHGLDWDIFAGFDLVLLGDIHKRQVISDSNPIVFFPGSLIQQNFGESFEGHGYALVDLTQDTIKYDFFDIPNQHGFFTLDVENGQLPSNLPITSKTNVRLRTRGTTPADLKRVLATIRKDYRNSNVIVQKLDRITGTDGSALFGESLHQNDVRNVQHQNQLISEYLKLQEVDDETAKLVLNINKNLNQKLNQGETARNVIWKPKKFEFSNMFSYGEGNVVDFSNLDGVCGLFAPNHAGKSAILDSLCFCLFDQSFRASKAEQVLNRKKDDFWCKLNFELGGVDYFIEKKAYKYKSGPLKGKLRVDIAFWYVSKEGEIISLNGEQRRDTDKIIQSYIGTFDDFILTALSLQGNNSNFIDKTQSERKELLANFLDLRIFDSLYELANKENKAASIILEEYQKQDFETRLGDAERVKAEYETKYDAILLSIDSKEVDIQRTTDELLELNKQLQPCKAEGLNVDQLYQNLEKSDTRQSSLSSQLGDLERQLVEVEAENALMQNQMDRFKQTFDKPLYDTYIKYVEEKTELDKKLANYKVTIKNKLEKLEKLQQHKYDPNCSYCTSNVFVQDAIQTKQQLEDDKSVVHDFLQRLGQVNDFVINNKHIQQQAEELQQLVQDFSNSKLTLERIKAKIDLLVKELDIESHKRNVILNDIELYKNNATILEQNKNIQLNINQVNNQLNILRSELTQLNNKAKDYHAKIAVADKTITESVKAIKHMQELSENQIAYDYYCKVVSKDGIPYNLISKAIPHIQQYANNILSQVIDFTLELETDGKNINAFICYDDNKWPLELSSGMERFMSSLALRIALIKITNLPKPDFIAIDEGLGVLDSSNLNSMHTLFLYMKDMFRFNLIISHIDVVRDMVDKIITIDRREDMSYINC